jgi:hypothetical protein
VLLQPGDIHARRKQETAEFVVQPAGKLRAFLFLGQLQVAVAEFNSFARATASCSSSSRLCTSRMAACNGDLSRRPSVQHSQRAECWRPSRAVSVCARA